MRNSFSFVLGLALAACSSGNTTPNPVTDGATDVQTADVPVADAPAADVPAADVQPDAPATQCGSMRPSLATASHASEGLAIAGDGTIYYTQAGAIGRITPDGTNTPAWVRIAGTSTLWGIALDVPRSRLYVGAPTNGTIYSLDLSADPPTSSAFVTGAGQPNGFTMGPDGALYYSDFSRGHVWRVDEAGMKTQVTMTAITQADGIAFYNGDLYVDGYSRGILYRLTVVNNVETARATVAMGLGSIDGLAFDSMGGIYVTNADGLVHLDPDGSNPMTLTALPGAAANIEFGAGALSCTDIYVATGSGLRRFEMGTVTGLDVPWHH